MPVKDLSHFFSDFWPHFDPGHIGSFFKKGQKVDQLVIFKMLVSLEMDIDQIFDLFVEFVGIIPGNFIVIQWIQVDFYKGIGFIKPVE